MIGRNVPQRNFHMECLDIDISRIAGLAAARGRLHIHRNLAELEQLMLIVRISNRQPEDLRLSIDHCNEQFLCVIFGSNYNIICRSL